MHGLIEHCHVSPILEADFLRVGLRVVLSKTVVASNHLVRGELDPLDIVSFFSIRVVFSS